jgi:hypothetical protein
MHSTETYARSRLEVVDEAMDRLGVRDENISAMKVSDFLPPKYSA